MTLYVSIYDSISFDTIPKTTGESATLNHDRPTPPCFTHVCQHSLLYPLLTSECIDDTLSNKWIRHSLRPFSVQFLCTLPYLTWIN